MAIDPIRLSAANEIITAYAPGRLFVADRSLIYFCWQDYKGKNHKLRWVPTSRGSDFPSIHRKVPFGGTCTVATMELYRWVRGERVRPLSMWKYFCSKTVGMNTLALELCIKHGWPITVPCVFCSRMLGEGVGYDHYDRDGYPVGPGCWYREGCSGEPEKLGVQRG